MLNINVVYLGTSEHVALRRGDVRIVWSGAPLPDCDLYAYLGAYSFFGRRPGPQVLVQGEPVVTQPREFTGEILQHFDHVLTLLDSLDGITPQISRWVLPACLMEPISEPPPTFSELSELYPTEGRRDAICMISGNKTSPIPGELYSTRVEIARWFHEQSDIPFDVFGQPAFEDLPNYVRPLGPDEKLTVLAGYRYSLCMENSYDPFWSRGYITEKLTECLRCRTVPIYLGCSNVEDHIPTECFIDYREFSGPADLDGFLRGVDDDKYHAYVDSIDAWLREGNLSEYHIWRLYDRLTELLVDAVGGSAAPLWREDTTWTPASVPDEPPTRDVDADGSLRTWDEMNVAPYWTWPYLTRTSLDECVASVESIRKTQTLGPAPRDDDERRREKPKRISRLLYIGVEKTYGNHPNELTHSARNLLRDWTAWPGVEVHYIDPGSRVGESGVAGMSEEVLEHVRSGDFDLVFCVPFARALDVLHDTMREMSLVTNTMVWAPYPPSQFETHSLPWASCADVVITTSDTDLRAFRAASHPARLIKSQWAFSPRAYTRVRAQRQPIVTVVGKRTEMRGRLCEYLAANGIDVEAYGSGWGNGRFLTEADFHRTFGESAINLSLEGRRRIYEVTGSGGFLMTTPVEGLDDAFVTDLADPARAEVVVVNDVRELLAKTRYYLERPREREAIALRGYRRARVEHTWARRLADVCAQAGLELPPIVP